MRKFILLTKSESGDNYHYFIESENEPNDYQLLDFLSRHGTGREDDTCFENEVALIEIPNEFICIKS